MYGISFRAQLLYEYLLEHAEEGRWISKEEIAESNKTFYHRDREKMSEHNSTAFALIRKDVDALNRNLAPYKIIASCKKGYKIATEEEAERYISGRFKKDLRALKKTWNLKRKMERSGQITMTPEGFQEIKTWVLKEDK